MEVICDFVYGCMDDLSYFRKALSPVLDKSYNNCYEIKMDIGG